METKRLRGEYTGNSYYANMLEKEVLKGNITEYEHKQILKQQHNKSGYELKGCKIRRYGYSNVFRSVF